MLTDAHEMPSNTEEGFKSFRLSLYLSKPGSIVSCQYTIYIAEIPAIVNLTVSS
jgi:hypothetical protein